MSAEETWNLFLFSEDSDTSVPQPARLAPMDRRELVGIEPTVKAFEIRNGRIFARATMVFRDAFGFEHRCLCLS